LECTPSRTLHSASGAVFVVAKSCSSQVSPVLSGYNRETFAQSATKRHAYRRLQLPVCTADNIGSQVWVYAITPNNDAALRPYTWYKERESMRSLPITSQAWRTSTLCRMPMQRATDANALWPAMRSREVLNKLRWRSNGSSRFGRGEGMLTFDTITFIAYPIFRPLPSRKSDPKRWSAKVRLLKRWRGPFVSVQCCSGIRKRTRIRTRRHQWRGRIASTPGL
jgi:hypothetical protein